MIHSHGQKVLAVAQMLCFIQTSLILFLLTWFFFLHVWSTEEPSLACHNFQRLLMAIKNQICALCCWPLFSCWMSASSVNPDWWSWWAALSGLKVDDNLWAPDSLMFPLSTSVVWLGRNSFITGGYRWPYKCTSPDFVLLFFQESAKPSKKSSWNVSERTTMTTPCADCSPKTTWSAEWTSKKANENVT